MPDQVEWNIAEDDATRLAAADVLANDRHGEGPRTPSRLRRRRFGARFWLFYVLTLTLAAGAGFGMGRFAESRQVLYDEIERALALEALAQRTEDATLLAETLDPEAHRAWRSRVTRELLAVDSPRTGLSILELELLDEDEVRVTVAPRGATDADPTSSAGSDEDAASSGDLDDQAVETELRRYRFVNGRWLHAPIEDPRQIR